MGAFFLQPLLKGRRVCPQSPVSDSSPEGEPLSLVLTEVNSLLFLSLSTYVKNTLKKGVI